MTGFIKGLFRSKPKAESVEPAEPTPPQPQAKPGAYYLTPDEAKTYGNVEYMRSTKSIRRTFSKKKVGEDNEMIRTVSAMEMQKAKQNGQAAPTPTTPKPPTNGAMNGSANGASAPASNTSEPIANSERRRADDSMDMFRNMARDLKKR